MASPRTALRGVTFVSMEPESGHLRNASADSAGTPPFEAFTDDELDALEALAEFELEHRRILAMQTLFYKRRKAGGVA
jgi:hypothetical protein